MAEADTLATVIARQSIPLNAAWMCSLFPNKDEAKRHKWLTVLLENEFETTEDLLSLDTHAWASMALPLAVRERIRTHTAGDE
jgi:hypothetical protein